MSLASVAAELQATRSAIAAAIQTKGVAVPPGTTFAGLAPLILLIEGGAGPVVREVLTAGGAPVIAASGARVVVLDTI